MFVCVCLCIYVCVCVCVLRVCVCVYNACSVGARASVYMCVEEVVVCLGEGVETGQGFRNVELGMLGERQLPNDYPLFYRQRVSC